MKRANAEAPSKAFRILLVDDNRNGLLARKSVLEEHGYEVHAHSAPCEALKAFEGQIFDLVVTDYRMPSMTGSQLIVEIRSLKPNVPVVLVSSVADVLGLDEKSTGANIVIAKNNTEITHLVRAVKRLLSTTPRKPARTQSSLSKSRKKTG